MSSERGRPKGPETKHVSVYLRPDHLRDLALMSQILDGRPKRNGLIQQAIEEFVAKRLEKPEIAKAYARVTTPGIRVAG